MKTIIKTHLWTLGDSKKIPVPLMNDHHLLCAYTRLIEIKYSKEQRITFYEMKTPVEEIDLPYINKWTSIFKEEIVKRKLKEPRINTIDLQRKFRKKQAKKEIKIIQNERFDKNFL